MNKDIYVIFDEDNNKIVMITNSKQGIEDFMINHFMKLEFDNIIYEYIGQEIVNQYKLLVYHNN